MGMQIRSTILALVATLLALSAQSSSQEPVEAAPSPLLASDGQPVLPGRVPEKTSEEAQRLWAAFRSAQSPSTGPRAPIHGFRLDFSLRLREKDQSNDGDATFAFLDPPGFLSCQMASSGRTLLLGPEGPFLIDGTEVVSLRGREGKDDRRRLEEWIAISRNFLALAQPERVRLVELRELEPEDVLPYLTSELATRARELDWLEVRSPDFHLYSSFAEGTGAQPVFRARLGLAREPAPPAANAAAPVGRGVKKPGELVLAILHEERQSKVVAASLQVIEVRSQTELAGYRLPAELAVWRASEDPPGGAMAFSPYVVLWLQPNGAIDPEFGADAFLPPKH
jgi:hypothetical protein